jgi:hypothetical protein
MATMMLRVLFILSEIIYNKYDFSCRPIKNLKSTFEHTQNKGKKSDNLGNVMNSQKVK